MYAEHVTFNDFQVVWVTERSTFIAYCERYPGLFAKDPWSAVRARRCLEDLARNVLVCNDLS
ncbi:hypothetical protein ACIRRA_33075 [Nocardia sp. NPDC101769]|uniref:hypothetical protein n=1 Tax=Nocardia sp. NPDC101769 TaxID=3364333 RepID=UPI00381C3C1F